MRLPGTKSPIRGNLKTLPAKPINMDLAEIPSKGHPSLNFGLGLLSVFREVETKKE